MLAPLLDAADPGPDELAASEADLDPDAVAVSPLPDPLPSPESVVDAPALALLPEALDRSFFAQPEPLNRTAGWAIALRSVPSLPHAGQNFGPGASMPWMTSVTCPQDAQT